MVPCSATSSIAASRNRARMVRSSGGGVERMFTIVYMCSQQVLLPGVLARLIVVGRRHLRPEMQRHNDPQHDHHRGQYPLMKCAAR